MASHQEVAEPQGEGMEGAEVRLEVWPELWLEVPDVEGAEVWRKAEVPLTISLHITLIDIHYIPF